MSVVPQLCLRRIEGAHVDWLTMGKLYPVKKVRQQFSPPIQYYHISDDHGDHMETIGRKPFWQHVWVFPNGTELEALE